MNKQPIFLEFPRIWQAAPVVNPEAATVNQAVLDWLLASRLLTKNDALYQTAENIAPGYFVGYPFPTVEQDRLYDIARLWTIELLWDDIDVEASLEEQARATQEVLALFMLDTDTGEVPAVSIPKPTDLVKEVLETMRAKHGNSFIKHHAEGMHLWYRAARKEQAMANSFRAGNLDFSFDDFFKNRCMTVGAIAGMSIDYVYNYDIPAVFHQEAAIQEMKQYAAAICAIGNDVCSMSKDLEKNWPSSITLRMKLENLSLMEAIEATRSAHLDYARRFDALAEKFLSRAFSKSYPFAADYIMQMRVYTSGVTLWETKAPRYAEGFYNHEGQKLIPEVCFVN